MDVLDVNVLLYSVNESSPQHVVAEQYVTSLATGSSPFAIPAVVFASFMRIATNPRFGSPTASMDDAIHTAEQLHSLPHCIAAVPGPNHWDIFVDLCRRGNARVGLVSDAYLAAIAIELGGVLVTADRGMARWPGLKWRDPFDNSTVGQT